ncbi:MAG: GNAT family N-acetyltransferase [Pseudomonadota bacterium]
MPSPVSIAPEDPETPDAQASLRAYFALLAERIPGIDQTHVPVPDPEASAFRPPQGVFLIARTGDAVFGCVSLKTVEPGLGEVKRLWVAPEARGQGLARRLMAETEAFARAAGMTRLRLDTNNALTEALALYRSSGWTPTEPFTHAFPATDWFAKRL